MEFIQFHPTTIIGKNILMTEGCRGEGGYIVNKDGERFMKKYAEKAMELAPRDIVSRSIQTEILQGRGFEDSYVHLDIRHLGRAKIMERLPGVRDICLDFLNLDPIDKPIPIQPGQHYTMGGISCNANGETEVKGLYAAGECACVSVHGANRLGGNSLLDTIVFGKLAGLRAAEYAKSLNQGDRSGACNNAVRRTTDKFARLCSTSGTENPYTIKKEMNITMDRNVGIFRVEAEMLQAQADIRKLRQRFLNIRAVSSDKRYNADLVWFLEIEGNLDVAEAIITGALSRKESRGSHSRPDFPKRDDANFLKHTIARHSPEGAKISYAPVTIMKYQPEERKY
jgi:succinate dehydrogenase / fumarate reductase flavoprotein subunit